MERLLECVPAVLATAVGTAQARAGLARWLDCFQNIHTNKHMCYIILEAALYKLFPEIPQRDLVSAFVRAC